MYLLLYILIIIKTYMIIINVLNYGSQLFKEIFEEYSKKYSKKCQV